MKNKLFNFIDSQKYLHQKEFINDINKFKKYLKASIYSIILLLAPSVSKAYQNNYFFDKEFNNDFNSLNLMNISNNSLSNNTFSFDSFNIYIDNELMFIDNFNFIKDFDKKLYKNNTFLSKDKEKYDDKYFKIYKKIYKAHNEMYGMYKKAICFLKENKKDLYSKMIDIYGSEEDAIYYIMTSTIAEHVSLNNIENEYVEAYNNFLKNKLNTKIDKDNSFGISRLSIFTVEHVNKRYGFNYTLNDLMQNKYLDLKYGILARIYLYECLIYLLRSDKNISKLGEDNIKTIAKDSLKWGWVFNRGPGGTMKIIRKMAFYFLEKKSVPNDWLEKAESNISKKSIGSIHIRKIRAIEKIEKNIINIINSK